MCVFLGIHCQPHHLLSGNSNVAKVHAIAVHVLGMASSIRQKIESCRARKRLILQASSTGLLEIPRIPSLGCSRKIKKQCSKLHKGAPAEKLKLLSVRCHYNLTEGLMGGGSGIKHKLTALAKDPGALFGTNIK